VTDAADRLSDTLLARLHSLHPKRIDLSLDRVERLLADLGHPQDRLPPVVHVAGTNGKGSTIAFLRAIVEAHGLTTHVYTSPHLVSFHERIVVAGRAIDERALAAVLAECETANAGRPVTLFEITTAAALLAFARVPADVTLLETGLGGRLDATNVVARPALTLLTPIGLDHQAFLGETIDAIAGEKAGIIKAGVPCLSAAQPAEASAVIRGRARALAAPLFSEGDDWSVVPTDDGFVYRSGDRERSLPPPALAGQFQLTNAGLAIAATTRLLTDRLDDEAVRAGVGAARWPGRMHHLRAGRLVHILPAGWELWLDGAHNPAAADAIITDMRRWRDRPLHLVFGMLRSKAAAGFLSRVGPLVGRCLTVAIPGESASLTAAEAAAAAHGVGLAAEPCGDMETALERLAVEERGSARVVICGSLYLVGAALRANGTLPP
jgi:dihydrofolate synthase/folylpolyglutamate synthase